MRKQPTKIDWNKAFIFYCTADERTGRMPTYRDVAENFAITERQVELIGSKYKWVDKRERFGKKSLERWKEERGKLIEKLEQAQFETWNDAVEIMQKQLTHVKNKQADAEAVEELLDDLFDELSMAKNKTERKEIKRKIANVMGRKVYGKELRETMEALRTSINGLRITLGMPTEITKGEMTNYNKDASLSEEDLEKMDSDFEKAHENKNPN